MCRNFEQLLGPWEVAISEQTVQLQNPLPLEHSGNNLASAGFSPHPTFHLGFPLLWLLISSRYDEDAQSCTWTKNETLLLRAGTMRRQGGCLHFTLLLVCP